VLKMGVRIPRRFDDAGEYLADARALDASGVDSLWLADEGLESWLLLAAIAAVTGRTRLVVPVRLADARAPEALEDRLTTLGRLSRGRVLVALSRDLPDGATRRDLVARLRRHECLVMASAADAPEACAVAEWADGVVDLDGARERLGDAIPSMRRRHEDAGLKIPLEIWATAPMPDDRAQWRSLRAASEAAGATGLIVPADPRLLDLLRNGDEEDDRADLGVAQG
jgi:hypothetical protein